MKIAILGAGHGGLATACDLSLAGHEVHLAALPEHPGCIRDIMAMDEVELTGFTATGALPGKVKIAMVTIDVKQAVKGVEVVFVIIPAFGQEAYMNILVECVEPGQLVIFCPGKFAALVFYKMLKTAGRENDVIVGETISLLYATKIQKPGLVLVKGVKEHLEFAAMPASRTSDALKVLNRFYPQFVAARNVLETSISDPGFIVHTVSTLMNASQIETRGAYPTAHYDITPGTARVMEEMDGERMVIAMTLGIPCLSLMEASHEMYGVTDAHNYYEAEMKITAHENQKAPSTLEHRYITEEVPYSLVPLEGLARALGLKTPTFDAIITLATHANDEFYQVTGRNLDKLGLLGMDKERIISYIS